MNNFKQVLSQYFNRNISNVALENILNNTFITINSIIDQKAKTKKRIIITSWYVSTVSVFASLLWLYVDLKNSGSLIMLKILITGFSSVVENWQEYFLSLTDLAPTYSLLGALLSMSVFILFNKLKSENKGVNLNQFII